MFILGEFKDETTKRMAEIHTSSTKVWVKIFIWNPRIINGGRPSKKQLQDMSASGNFGIFSAAQKKENIFFKFLYLRGAHTLYDGLTFSYLSTELL